MATAIVMPKLGNTVESSIIMRWHKAVGDPIEVGDIICEVETDKATLEVESTASGTVLALFFDEGDDVPVMVNIAAVGEPGEPIEHLRPETASPSPAKKQPGLTTTFDNATTTIPVASSADNGGRIAISPRAKNLAMRKGIALDTLSGTGPGGRIIERDVQMALEAAPKMTPLAQSMLRTGEFSPPAQGSGPRGRVMSHDLIPIDADIEAMQLSGRRRIIAQRMLESLQTTAQLTLNATADARALLNYRQRLKDSPEALALRDITINDLILFVVSRTLLDARELNATLTHETLRRHRRVHLGFAVDTPRGLIVPVIRDAHTLSLKQLANEAHRLADACLTDRITPDELNGGTFTVTNLGSFGIESFTPILNPPQVGILGVGNINPKPIEHEGDVIFAPHIGLSLTINHQVVDGAPGARFLQKLASNMANLETLLAF